MWKYSSPKPPGDESDSDAGTVVGKTIPNMEVNCVNVPELDKIPIEQPIAKHKGGQCMYGPYLTMIRNLIDRGILPSHEKWFGLCLNERSTKACAARPHGPRDEYPGIFHIDTTWMMDTGCGNDLVWRELIDKYIDIVKPAPVSMAFVTAAGETNANNVSPARPKAISSKFDAGKAPLYILDSTPSVLSVGKRCVEGDYAFIWLLGSLPCLITPFP